MNRRPASEIAVELIAAQRLLGRHHAERWHALSPSQQAAITGQAVRRYLTPWVNLTPEQKAERRAAADKRKRLREAERRKKRYQQDPQWRIVRCVSRSLRAALLGRNRASIYEAAVGYTIAQLRAHLEAKFQPGMSWDNAPRWHIDHIKPAASFAFTSIHDEAFRRCYALANLQPLWAMENCIKDARYALEHGISRRKRPPAAR